MTRAGRFRNRKTVAAGSAVLLAVLGGAITAPAQAVPVEGGVTVPDCPAAYPLSSVTTDTVGQGLTVVSGTTPEPFKVEVVGVLKGFIGPGKDLIMVNLSDLPGGHVIDQGGGGWAGISGSPVYVNGELLGALSYGFTASPSPLMGLTPAAYMNPLLDLGAATQATVQANRGVKLSPATRKQLAARAGTAVPQGGLKPIVTPLGVSGLASQRVERLQTQLTEAGRPYRAYAAGGSSGNAVGGAPATRPAAGGNFAYTLSSGDLDVFGIGTTTSVCHDQALAFGHYIDNAGPVSYTANTASTVTIAKDDAFGPYKLANLGETIGTLDQDRTTGVRADLTRTPDTTIVTTDITNGDTDTSRTGTTSVSDPKSLAGLLPYIVFAGQYATFDESGDGVATSDWTISGKRAGGAPFSITRSNSWAARDDVTVAPAVDVAAATDQLINNDYENVTIDDVSFTSTLKTAFHQRHLTFLSVSVNGGRWTTAKRLNVRVGDKLRMHVGMKEYRGVGTRYSLLSMTVPKKARGQVADLSVIGGSDLNSFDGFDEGCLFEDECGDSSEDGSLDTIISSITSAPRNDSVVAELSYENDNGDTVTAAKATKRNTLTVTGERDITLRVS